MRESNNDQSKDRRHEHRESVRHPATLQSAQHGEISFLIRNFSTTSMYLGTFDGRALADDKQASKIQHGDEMFVCIKIKGKPIVNVAASVNRVGELGVGITFFKTQERLDADLKQVASEQGFVVGDASPMESAIRQSLLKELREVVMEFVKRRSKQLIETSNNSLFEMAGKLGANASQAPFFDAMGVLRKHGSEIREDYVAGVQSHLKEFKQLELFAGFDAEKSAGSELSLVDEREFENWLALSEIMNTAESRNHRELHMLEARMAVVLDARVDSRNNPVSPAALCHHLYEAVKDREFEHAPLQVIWRSFNDTSVAALTTLYKQLNQILIKAGILPKLSFRFGPVGETAKSRRSQTQAVESEPADDSGDAHAAPVPATTMPADPTTPLGEAQDTARDAGATVIDLAQILRARQPASHPDGGATVKGGRPTKSIGMDELNAALLELQGAGQPDQKPLSTRITDALQHQQGSKGRRQLGDDHAQAVYLAQELLRAINNDEVLEPQAKQWVQRLEVPLLRLLLDDDAILRNPEHPARRLINQLGHAQAGLSDPRTERDRQVVEKIETIVDELGRSKSPDTRAFADANEQIKALLKRQQRLRAIQIKRLLEACDGQQKLDSARAKVQGELDRRFAGEEVPRVIVDLLKLGLRKMLDLAAVRTGIEGDEYVESIGLIDDLRASLSPGHQPQAADRQNSQSLVKRIEEKLIQANTEPAARHQLTQQLEAILPGLGGDPGRQSAEMIAFPAPATPAPMVEQQMEEGFDQDHALWLGRAKLLQVGSWMLYPTADGKTKPLKLAWVSDEHDRYVFVDRQGHKALEITPTELAERLKGDGADIIDRPDEPLMDRSWQGMIQHMHEQIAHQATHDQLTDVLNRKEFERQLRLKLGESKLMQSCHVALQIDIDQFRVINSTSGHDAGDQLLRDVAKLVARGLARGRAHCPPRWR